MDLLKYPKELTNNRQQIEAAFVFTLWKEPDLFGEYTVISQNPKNELITTLDGKFYYLLGLKMFEKGYRNYDEITVSSYLQDYPEVKKEFDTKGGMATVKELTSLVHEDNIDGYYDNLVKANILLKLYDKGFDVLGNIDKFKEMTSEDVYDFFDYQLNSVAIESNHNFEIEDLLIDDEFLAECERGDAQGLSYKKYTPIMNSMTMGIPLGELFMIGGFSGVGKALAVTEPIITPNGVVPMGDIKLGDYVIGEDGKKTKVIGVFPQGKRDAYKITFHDGSSVVCDKEHLWKYKTLKDNEKKKDVWRVNTLGEILKNHNIRQTNGARNIRIPRQQPVIDFENHQELIIPPYALGLLLGDGSLCGSTITFSNSEDDVINKIKEECSKFGYFAKPDHEPYKYTFKAYKTHHNQLRTNLRELKLLGTKSENKFIPKRYLLANYSDRLKLVQGLIDTDGHVDCKGHVSFTSRSKQLRDDLAFVIRSLGYRVTIGEHDRRRQDKGIDYQLIVCGYAENLFTSKKHRENFSKGKQDRKKYHYEQLRVSSVEKLDEQVEMQCIMVDNESHTYLCSDFIVTHNSSFVFENMILPLTMDNIKCTIISNEQRSKDFKLLLLVHVLTRDLGYYGLTRRKLKAGGFTDEQKEMLDKARDIIAEKYSDIKFVKLFDNDMDKVKKVIRKQAKVGHQVFMFDTMKSEDQIDEAMWQQLLIHSRKLFQLASKENISIICTYQLALSKLNTRYLDASCLSNAKQIKEVFSEMVYFRPLADDEYDGERYAVEPTRLEKDEEGKFTGRKIHMPLTDKDKRYLIAFIDKTRNGEDKKQILYEFNGAYNHWKEIGNCKVLNTYN